MLSNTALELQKFSSIIYMQFDKITLYLLPTPIVRASFLYKPNSCCSRLVAAILQCFRFALVLLSKTQSKFWFCKASMVLSFSFNEPDT